MGIHQKCTSVLFLTPASGQDDAEAQCRFLTPKVAEQALNYWVYGVPGADSQRITDSGFRKIKIEDTRPLE